MYQYEEHDDIGFAPLIAKGAKVGLKVLGGIGKKIAAKVKEKKAAKSGKPTPGKPGANGKQQQQPAPGVMPLSAAPWRWAEDRQVSEPVMVNGENMGIGQAALIAAMIARRRAKKKKAAAAGKPPPKTMFKKIANRIKAKRAKGITPAPAELAAAAEAAQEAAKDEALEAAAAEQQADTYAAEAEGAEAATETENMDGIGQAALIAALVARRRKKKKEAAIRMARAKRLQAQSIALKKAAIEGLNGITGIGQAALIAAMIARRRAKKKKAAAAGKPAPKSIFQKLGDRMKKIKTGKKKEDQSYLRRVMELKRQKRAGTLTEEQYKIELGKLKAGRKRRLKLRNVAAKKIQSAARKLKRKKARAERKKKRDAERVYRKSVEKRFKKIEQKPYKKTLKNKIKLFE